MQYIFISFLEVAYAYNWAIILELFWSTIIFHPDKSKQKFCRIIRIGTHSLKRRLAITFPLYLVQQNLMLRKFGAVRDWSSTPITFGANVIGEVPYRPNQSERGYNVQKSVFCRFQHISMAISLESCVCWDLPKLSSLQMIIR